MNYDARQREDLRWEYTCIDTNTPIGYCTPYVEPNFDEQPITREWCVFAIKHHDIGHETEVEARTCYKEYLLDHTLEYHALPKSKQDECLVCGEVCQTCISVNGVKYQLCKIHSNRTEVENLFPTPGQLRD